jgi:hypothetical protein
MQEEPYYFRPESYLYLLQSHPSYYFCVGRSDAVQALWGLVGKEIYVIKFTLSGDLKDAGWLNQTDLLISESILDYDVTLDKVTAYLQNEFHLVDQTISIKRFWLSEVNAGIEDVTDNIKECLLEPSSFTPEEIEDCQESLEIWKSDEQFAFWWDQNFYMSSEGLVEAS